MGLGGAQKRGQGRVISLDATQAEDRLSREAADALTRRLFQALAG
jgi:hypothetical protein